MLNEQTLNALVDLFSESGKNEVWVGTWRSPMKIEIAEDIAVFMGGNREGELVYANGRWEGCGFSLSNEDLIVMMNDDIITKCVNVSASNALTDAIDLTKHDNEFALFVATNDVVQKWGASNTIAVLEILRMCSPSDGQSASQIAMIQSMVPHLAPRDEMNEEFIKMAYEIMQHTYEEAMKLLVKML